MSRVTTNALMTLATFTSIVVVAGLVIAVIRWLGA
jgi:hypothetical protein